MAGFFSDTMSGSGGERRSLRKCSYTGFPSHPHQATPAVEAALTLLLQLIDVSHDSPEEGSLVGVVVHAAGHEVSQLLTRWCHWPAPAFVESLFLSRGGSARGGNQSSTLDLLGPVSCYQTCMTHSHTKVKISETHQSQLCNKRMCCMLFLLESWSYTKIIQTWATES